ncbi:hypothetical protein EMIT0P291_100041 [Pseudomonas sp. IT-P291]
MQGLPSPELDWKAKRGLPETMANTWRWQTASQQPFGQWHYLSLVWRVDQVRTTTFAPHAR